MEYFKWHEALHIEIKDYVHVSKEEYDASMLPKYTLQGELVPKVATYKYLGVHINNQLNWNDHLNAVAAKANQTLGFLGK